jgi:hypothetical protein
MKMKAGVESTILFKLDRVGFQKELGFHFAIFFFIPCAFFIYNCDLPMGGYKRSSTMAQKIISHSLFFVWFKELKEHPTTSEEKYMVMRSVQRTSTKNETSIQFQFFNI